MQKVIRLMIALIIGMILILFLPEIGQLFVSNPNELSEDNNIVIDNITVNQDSTFTKTTLDYWINDSIYYWDDQKMNWISTGLIDKSTHLTNSYLSKKSSSISPTKLKWDVLMNINYRLKYFKSII